jgi:rfaE bifunctional protein kinase chain/domain
MSAGAEQLVQLVPALAGRRVAVLGDAILDEYLVGRPVRISREAPVLVLEFSRRFCRAGGAANPAVNIQALGSTAELVALAGDDPPVQALLEELARAGLSAERLVQQTGAQTNVKTRLLAEDGSSRQHLARLDYRPARPDERSRRQLAERLASAAETADALLLSDYRGGVIDAELIALARTLGRQHRLLVCVDSQGDLLQFTGLDLVKCNLAEAEAALGRSLRGEPDLEAAGATLLERLGAARVVVTRGPDGMSAFEAGRQPVHLAAANRTEVFDVTGAGDTVIAVLTLGLVAGASLEQAVRLANAAAGLVVRRLGVATASPAELAAALAAPAGC